MNVCIDHSEDPCNKQRAREDVEEKWPGLSGSKEKAKRQGDARSYERNDNAGGLPTDSTSSPKEVLRELRYNWIDKERRGISRPTFLHGSTKRHLAC